MPPGYQLKYRATEDGTLVVGYLRNLAEIRLYRPETPSGSPGTVTGSWIRVRKPAAARLSWQLAAGNYTLSVWDLDTGAKTQADVPGLGGAWERGETDHDFVLVWRLAGNAQKEKEKGCSAAFQRIGDLMIPLLIRLGVSIEEQHEEVEPNTSEARSSD